jgi:two-component system, NarL family, response regulator NreC
MPSHLQLAPLADTRERPAPASSSGPEQPIRVLLADDHPGMLASLRRLLDRELDVDVVGAECSLHSLADDVLGQHPDVLVLDLSLPGGSSLETIGRLREQAPQTEVVVLTMQDSPAIAQRALSVGASGYVTKDHADTELPEAIRAAVRGEQYVSPQVAARMEELHRALTGRALTPREVEVLRLIALGHTSVEIARKLRLSPRTVETHRAHIHKKLGLGTRAQLVGYALRRGLIGT